MAAFSDPSRRRDAAVRGGRGGAPTTTARLALLVLACGQSVGAPILSAIVYCHLRTFVRDFCDYCECENNFPIGCAPAGWLLPLPRDTPGTIANTRISLAIGNAHLLPEGGFVHHDPQGKLDTAAYGKRIKQTVKLLKLIWGKGPNGPSSALDGDDDPADDAAMDGESDSAETPRRANVFGGDNDA